jgi:hypothetical protein
MSTTAGEEEQQESTVDEGSKDEGKDGKGDGDGDKGGE